MIQSEDMNEFVHNMKLKKSVIGGIKEESVYENMRKLSDLYEAQINELKEQIQQLQEREAILEASNQEQNRIFIEKMKQHQTNIEQIIEVCRNSSDQVNNLLEDYNNEMSLIESKEND